MKKNKIILTGSTGYLGTKFINLYGSQFNILGVARTEPSNTIDLLDLVALKRVYSDFRPDFVLHLAALPGRDASTDKTIIKTTTQIIENLISLAQTNQATFIFSSTEAVYGGKEKTGGYVETDPYKPRNLHGASKVACEKLLKASGLPYLITRGHRHVGINNSFNKPKQFTDALHALQNGQVVHLDSNKLFTPVLINNMSDVFAHYMLNDSDKQLILNVGVDKDVTFYALMLDVAKTLGIETSLIKSDGDETGWPLNSSLSVKKLRELNYPFVSYQKMLETIKTYAG